MGLLINIQLLLFKTLPCVSRVKRPPPANYPTLVDNKKYRLISEQVNCVRYSKNKASADSLRNYHLLFRRFSTNTLIICLSTEEGGKIWIQKLEPVHKNKHSNLVCAYFRELVLISHNMIDDIQTGNSIISSNPLGQERKTRGGLHITESPLYNKFYVIIQKSYNNIINLEYNLEI